MPAIRLQRPERDHGLTIPNVLLIGLTNRRELLDAALLRPGRLEVQIEVPLPDAEGRREIFQLHFEALRKRGRLSAALCCAIDGVAMTTSNKLEDKAAAVDEPIPRRKRLRIQRLQIGRASCRERVLDGV